MPSRNLIYSGFGGNRFRLEGPCEGGREVRVKGGGSCERGQMEVRVQICVVMGVVEGRIKIS